MNLHTINKGIQDYRDLPGFIIKYKYQLSIAEFHSNAA